ncbi:hypothetical protein QA601_18485 [Chitinispirillales bacterium ANBcel5]|uniref:hypothetical protein n=1 Tax=Cellulosispirillum alkaliphilum TaxID=3039283 RepID=UPI002A58D2E6|nr:hypothetical protein [Chitinispirillales bacterium ANBcel5]
MHNWFLKIIVCVWVIVLACKIDSNKQVSIPSESVNHNKTVASDDSSDIINNNNLNSCKATKFKYSDSTGLVRGIVIALEDTSITSGTGGIQIVDSDKDSIWISFTYHDMPDMDLNQISIGSCIEITFYADIRRVTSKNSEDGPVGYEICRSFYINNIKHD